MKRLNVKIYCEKDGEWKEPLEQNANRIDEERSKGYEIEIKVIVDGTRRVVFKYED